MCFDGNEFNSDGGGGGGCYLNGDAVLQRAQASCCGGGRVSFEGERGGTCLESVDELGMGE